MGAWFLEGQPEQARLRDAAIKGGASLCAGGNIPGLISDVLPLFLTGYTGCIRQLRMWQRNDMASGPSAVQIQVLGVGLPPGEGAHAEATNLGCTHSMEQPSPMTAHALGVEWQGVSLEAVEYALAPEDYVLPASGLEIRKGMAAGVRWTFSARAGGREFFRLVTEQSTRLDHGPGWRTSLEELAWRVEIDGDPPIVCTFGWPEGTEPGKACHDLNAVRAINMLPRLIEAKPGALTVLDFPAPVASDGLLLAD